MDVSGRTTALPKIFEIKEERFTQSSLHHFLYEDVEDVIEIEIEIVLNSFLGRLSITI